MDGALQAAALACSASAVLCSALALLRRHDLRLAAGVLLDLLLAAGLLRLTAAPDGTALVPVAVLVLARRVVVRAPRSAHALGHAQRAG